MKDAEISYLYYILSASVLNTFVRKEPCPTTWVPFNHREKNKQAIMDVRMGKAFIKLLKAFRKGDPNFFGRKGLEYKFIGP